MINVMYKMSQGLLRLVRGRNLLLGTLGSAEVR